MKRIPLTKGQFAIVDDADYEWLRQWSWCVHTRRGEYYAKRRRSNAEGGGHIFMHRQIAMTPPGMDTDHINHDILDNRRSNLRWASRIQNQVNCRGLPSHNKSGLLGVSRARKKWQARLSLQNRKRSLGTYESADEAALVRDMAVYCLYGDRATLNNPEVAKRRQESLADWLSRVLTKLERIRKAG
jgi:hypothetical protein